MTPRGDIVSPQSPSSNDIDKQARFGEDGLLAMNTPDGYNDVSHETNGISKDKNNNNNNNNDNTSESESESNESMYNNKFDIDQRKGTEQTQGDDNVDNKENQNIQEDDLIEDENRNGDTYLDQVEGLEMSTR